MLGKGFFVSKTCATLIAVALCSNGHANNVAERLTRISEETAILTAEEQQAAVRARIAERLSAAGQGGDASALDFPVVLSVAGLDGKLIAHVSVRGASYYVKTGEKIRGNFTVSQISGAGVEFFRHGKKSFVPVGYSGEASSASTSIIPR